MRIHNLRLKTVVPLNEGNNKGNVPDLAIASIHKPLELTFLTFWVGNHGSGPVFFQGVL